MEYHRGGWAGPRAGHHNRFARTGSNRLNTTTDLMGYSRMTFDWMQLIMCLVRSVRLLGCLYEAMRQDYKDNGAWKEQSGSYSLDIISFKGVAFHCFLKALIASHNFFSACPYYLAFYGRADRVVFPPGKCFCKWGSCTIGYHRVADPVLCFPPEDAIELGSLA